MSILIGSSQRHNSKVCTFTPPSRKESDILNDMEDIFRSLGLEVVRPKASPVIRTICRSIWVRDSSVNIDNHIIMLPGWSSGRKDEWKTHPYAKGSVIAPHQTEQIEGGDIIQHGDLIIIGLGKRTNKAGVIWLTGYIKSLGLKKRIITVAHTALHLDCCLSILPGGELIYSKWYIPRLPVVLKKLYTVIELENIIGKQEEPNLATNMVVVGTDTIVTTDQKRYTKLRKFLRDRGYNVIEIEYGTMWKLGGGIRCLTQWLELPGDSEVF